jgi:hypothetical protein
LVNDTDAFWKKPLMPPVVVGTTSAFLTMVWNDMDRSINRWMMFVGTSTSTARLHSTTYICRSMDCT